MKCSILILLWSTPKRCTKVEQWICPLPPGLRNKLNDMKSIILSFKYTSKPERTPVQLFSPLYPRFQWMSQGTLVNSLAKKVCNGGLSDYTTYICRTKGTARDFDVNDDASSMKHEYKLLYFVPWSWLQVVCILFHILKNILRIFTLGCIFIWIQGHLI